MLNSLSQTLIKLASPGVPDIYQGQEIWDFSLVDPDNRRPVDYAARQDALQRLSARLEREPRGTVARALLDSWEDGGPKLFVTHTGLQLRQRRPDLFRVGDYVPLQAEGEHAEHVFAFARQHQDQTVIVIASRLHAELAPDRQPWPINAAQWLDTRITGVAGLAGRYRNLFGDGEVDFGEAPLVLSELLQAFPVALLELI